MPSPPKPDQSSSKLTSPTDATNGEGSDFDHASQSGAYLTTAQGLRLSDTDHSLKGGDRGPTLLEDFHLREKGTHFDHERIPERVVHARGARRVRVLRHRKVGYQSRIPRQKRHENRGLHPLFNRAWFARFSRHSS
jgi:hypothetical protein